MMESIKHKILNMKDIYNIESNEEFFIVCGQMAKYLKSKTSTDVITNELYRDYLMINRTKQLMNVLKRDKKYLDYNNQENSRSNKIMCGLTMFYEKNKENLKDVNENYFNIGLYFGNCLLYVKKENNKDVKGEK